MLNREELENALREATSAHLHAYIPLMAQIIEDLTEKQLSLPEADQKINSNGYLFDIAKELKDRTIKVPGSVISFGENVQSGDFSAENIAGRDIIFHITINLLSNTPKIDGTLPVLQHIQVTRFNLAIQICTLADKFVQESDKMRRGVVFGDELKDFKDGDSIMLIRQRKAAEILANLQQVNQEAKFILPCGLAVDKKIGELFEAFNIYSVYLYRHFNLGTQVDKYLSNGCPVPIIFEEQSKDSFDKVFLPGGNDFINSIKNTTTELNSLLILYT